MKKIIIIWAIGFLSFWNISSQATVISGKVTGGSSFKKGGTFVKLTVPFKQSNPPNTVGSNTFNKHDLYSFDEDQNIVIDKGLNVDIRIDRNGKQYKKDVVPAGTTVASHYIFYDPLSGNQKGEVTFDSDIIAIISSSDNLKSSDYLANTGVTYQNPGARGLEKTDRVFISGPRTITVKWKASTPGDYIRVLTEYSPGEIFLLPD